MIYYFYDDTTRDDADETGGRCKYPTGDDIMHHAVLRILSNDVTIVQQSQCSSNTDSNHNVLRILTKHSWNVEREKQKHV